MKGEDALVTVHVLPAETEVESILRRLQPDKYEFDFCKHLTTLSTGVLVVTMAIAKTVTKDPQYKYLLIVAFAFSLACVYFSLAGMVRSFFLSRFERGDDSEDDKKWLTFFASWGLIAVAAGAFCFNLSLIALFIFVYRNVG